MRLLIACLLMAVAVEASAQFKTETDRFTGKTTIGYSGKSFGVPGAGQFRISTYTVKAQDEPETHFMFLIRTGSGWRYLRCDSVNWLLDGKPFDLPKPDFQRDTMRGGVIEGMIFYFSKEKLAQMAAASSLEVKVCNDELAFPPEDLAGLRQVYEAS